MACGFSGPSGSRHHLGTLVNSKAGNLCCEVADPEAPGPLRYFSQADIRACWNERALWSHTCIKISALPVNVWLKGGYHTPRASSFSSVKRES